MMRIPESFERLLSNLVVGSSVHQQHAEKHDVTGNAARLCVMNFNSQLWPYLRLFYVEEARQPMLADTTPADLGETGEAAHLT